MQKKRIGKAVDNTFVKSFLIFCLLHLDEKGCFFILKKCLFHYKTFESPSQSILHNLWNLTLNFDQGMMNLNKRRESYEYNHQTLGVIKLIFLWSMFSFNPGWVIFNLIIILGILFLCYCGRSKIWLPRTRVGSIEVLPGWKD